MRIGVYICHCGSNIAGVVDVEELAKFAEGLPGVAVCPALQVHVLRPGPGAGQAGHRASSSLNRIVVAACSPNLHEPTFRRAAEDAGLNRFLVQMANIREQVAWVTEDKADALEKAKAHLAAAIRRVAGHEPLQRQFVRIMPRALVVGGGIAGIEAALTLADAGTEVILVEREPSIGGHMAMFDKTFPTLDCAACILTPKMTAVKLHPNIKMLTYSTRRVGGGLGGQLPREGPPPAAVHRREPVRGLHAVHRRLRVHPGQVPQPVRSGAGPAQAGVGPLPPGRAAGPGGRSRGLPADSPAASASRAASTACGERNAFRFDQQERIEEYDVGAIIVATGFKAFDPSVIPYYGYGKYPNVYTSLEVERLLNAGGPTSGKLVLRDGSTPKRVGIIHCVGSRDANYHAYCSRVCCMYALKLAHLVREKTEAEVYNCYIDMRTPGKGFEEFYNRVQNEGVQFIRGKVADITPAAGQGTTAEGGLVMQVDDTLLGRIRKIHVDMVILAVALEPQADAGDVRRTFGISCSAEGFFLEKHPKLAPVNTANDGVFLAGACQGAKDIPDTVAQADAAAGQGPGADRRRPDRAGAEHGLDRRGHVLRLQDVHPALPLQGDHATTKSGRSP